MPTSEGSARTGWLILFTVDETRRIARPVDDYGGTVAAAVAFIPAPVVSHAISLGMAGITMVAKKAVRNGKSLGIYIHANPYRFAYLRNLKASDLPRLLYVKYTSGWLVSPFLYDEKDPQSLVRWRRAVGM